MSFIRLYSLLEAFKHQAILHKTLQELEYIVSNCKTVSEEKTAPKRYFVTMLTTNTRFNAKCYIELMFIEVSPVL